MTARLREIVVACALALPGAAGAASWTELGDAPVLVPGQTTLGSGGLTLITGDLVNASDVDVFAISISDPATFSVRVESFADPQVFLFDLEGFGIAANDDELLSNLNASLLPGDALYATLPPGVYALAVSNFNVEPFSADGPIFPDAPVGVLGPTGAGGDAPLQIWVNVGTSSGGPADAYRIELTGATFAPEPAWSIAAGVGLVSALAAARRRARR